MAYCYATASSYIEPDILPIIESRKRFIISQTCREFTQTCHLFNGKVRAFQSQRLLWFKNLISGMLALIPAFSPGRRGNGFRVYGNIMGQDCMAVQWEFFGSVFWFSDGIASDSSPQWNRGKLKDREAEAPAGATEKNVSPAPSRA